jgi:TRAP transporter T-component
LNIRIAETIGKWKKMRGAAILIGSAVLLSNSVSCSKLVAETPKTDGGDPKAATEKLAEAAPLYAQREDLGKARQAVALLREAQLADYGSYEANWRLAQADYYLGDHTPNERERDTAFREGQEAAKSAIRLQSGKPEGHFWLGANYGGSAQYNTLANLSSVTDIRTEMEAVLKIDEGFQFGSAYLGLGQLYLQAPRMLGGDHQKALGYLEKGLPFGPDNAVLRLRLAEAYHLLNRDQDARKQIDYMTTMKLNPAFEAEYRQAIEKAKKLASELKN